MKKSIKIIILIALLLAGIIAQARENNDRPLHEVHSMLVFNFLKYIEWPESAKTGKFTIAVIGDKDVYESLNSLYSSRKIAGMSVEILNHDDVSSLANAHMVYLASKKSNDFDELKSKTDGKSTLIITDKNGLGKKGSSINFKQVGGKLKFEINEEAMNNAQLKVSTQLLAMGIAI